MSKLLKLLDGTGITLSAICTVLQTDEVLQIIQLVLTIIATLVVMFFNIWKWYKSAKADGKITADEIKAGLDIVSNAVDDIKDDIDNKEGE